MRAADLARFTASALNRQRFRSAMLLLSVAIGVAAVVILVSLGEGARNYVIGQFDFMGTNMLVMFPGRKSTTGVMPPVTGVAARDITLGEIAILERSVPGIESIAPIVVGSAPASFGSRERDSTVLGTTSAFFSIRRLEIARGVALPELPYELGSPVAVIGETVRSELFGAQRAIGQWIRLRDYRFRVIGVVEGRGDSFGMDLSEAIFIPVASAQSAFNVHGMFRVVLRLRPGWSAEELKHDVLARMRELHQGEEDVTIISPDAMVRTFDKTLRVLTLGVAGIAAVSLLVAGILVMNLTLISVTQRTAEIGILKAIGATDTQVRTLFLTEAGSVALLGALAGAAAGSGALTLMQRLFPVIPFATPAWALLSSMTIACVSALLFAWVPAGRAARMEPVSALGKL